MTASNRSTGRLHALTGAALVCLSLLLVCLMLVRRSAADQPLAPPFDEEPLTDAIRQAIIAELKDKYQDDKHWGQTTQALRGMRLRGRGKSLHWEMRTKAVNDGLWKRYVVTVVEPDQQLHVGLDNVHLTDQGRLAFVLRLVARLRGEGHIEQWKLGVKLLGTSAQGDATVAATIDCDVGIQFEAGKVASDVLLDPHVTAIRLDLVDLDVRRIGRLGGKAAHELGDSFTSMVARQLKRREGKLVEKANASIAKNRDHLRLPVDKFVTTGWAKIQSLIPTSMAARETPAPPEDKEDKLEGPEMPPQEPNQPGSDAAVTE
jgi:hypothetical protein